MGVINNRIALLHVYVRVPPTETTFNNIRERKKICTDRRAGEKYEKAYLESHFGGFDHSSIHEID